MQIGVGLSLPLLATRRASAAFSPASLFTSGVQGAWYDPSDYSTLFQDSAGTTPVTAVEQPVGLMLDKSQGLVLGSDLLNGAGNPFSNIADWPITVGGGSRALNGTALTVTYAVSSTVAGKTFVVSSASFVVITYTLSSITSGTARILVSNSPGDGARRIGTSYSVPGTYTEIVFLPAGTFYLELNKSDAGSANFSVVSDKTIAGNHASQATTASRPVLRARYNLLTYSEQFDNAVWTKGGGSTVTANSVTAPDGTTTADTLVLTTGSATSQLYQSVAITNGPVTVSVWLRADAPVTLDFGFYDSASDVGSINVTTEWQRFTRTRAGGLTGADRRACWLYKGSAGGTTVYVWGADLRTGSSAGTYQRIAAATDYATAGFLPYLYFITDDSLSTGSIDFSATDKMFLCAGLTKSSDSATAILAELSADTNSNNGAFYFAAPLGAAANYTVVSKGTLSTNAGYTNSAVAAPVTNVVAMASAISTDSLALRVNGTQVATSAGDQGTGNYGNLPLYLGRRGNTSFPLNGNLYQMIVCGKTLSAAELASTEAYVNSKTGAY